MIKIAYFNDGPLLPIKEGGAEKIVNLIRHENVKNQAEVILFECNRPWTNMKELKKESFKSIILSENTFYNEIDSLVAILNSEKVNACIFTNPETLLNIGSQLKKYGFKIIYDCHNVFSLLARRMNQSEERADLIEYKEYLVGNIADLVLPCSEYDLKSLETIGISNEKMRIVENGVDSKSIVYVGPNLKNKKILFLGNIFYEPNYQAVKDFAYVFNKTNLLNDYELIIAGTVPENLVNELGSDRIKFLGYVKDLNQIFKKSSVAIAPLKSGSGTRLKILNYLAAGIPTISTEIGAEGLEISKNEVIIENDIEKYPQIIIDIENHIYNRLSINGRKLIEDKYDWGVIGKKAIQFIKNAI